MSLCAGDEERRRRFGESYLASQSPVMQAIERRVCGCDYGATSWTTREQADHMGQVLGLRSGLRLLDVGAGAGWPGPYLAKTSGCVSACGGKRSGIHRGGCGLSNDA